MSGLKEVFATALTDVSDKDIEGLGQVRVEASPVLGVRKFRWVRNISGATLAKGDSMSYEKRMQAPISALVNTDKSLVEVAAATFTVGDLVDFYLRVDDDAGGAGAAPEGEISKIKSNTASQVTLVDALTAAVTTSDTILVFRPWYVVDSADADTRPEWAGIAMSAAKDKEYFWVQYAGFNLDALVVASGTAIANGAALKPGAAILIAASDTADNGEVVAAAVANGIASDQVRRVCPVYLMGCD